jgi:hypothetical protein
VQWKCRGERSRYVSWLCSRRASETGTDTLAPRWVCQVTGPQPRRSSPALSRLRNWCLRQKCHHTLFQLVKDHRSLLQLLLLSDIASIPRLFRVLDATSLVSCSLWLMDEFLSQMVSFCSAPEFLDRKQRSIRDCNIP